MKNSLISLSQLLLLAIAAFPYSAAVTHAQYSAVRLVPTGVKANEYAGAKVQSTAIGGGKVALGSPLAVHPKTNVQTGGVYLWDAKTGKALPTLFPPALDAAAGMAFGEAIAINGIYLAVGAPAANGKGAVFVFNIGTLKLIQKIQDTTFLAGDKWGASVAIDRNDVAIGAPGSDVSGADAGNCKVYNLTTKTLVSAIPTGGLAAGDAYGSMVAIRNGLVAVGAPAADSSTGMVFLMDIASPFNGAIQNDNFVGQIDNPSPEAGDKFGTSISFLGAGILAVGAPGDNTQAAAAGSVTRILVIDPLSPTVISEDPGLYAGDAFGSSVVGAPLQLYVGTPKVDLDPDDLVNAPTEVGDVVSLGGPLFIPPPLNERDEMGTSIAYSDGLLVASAPFDDTGASDAGAVWLFKAPRASSLNLAGNGVRVLKADTAAGAGQSVFGTFSAISVPQSSIMDAPTFLAKITGPGTVGGKSQGIWSYARTSPSTLDVPLAPVLTGGPKLASTAAPTDLVANSITSMVNNVDDSIWYRGVRLLDKKKGIFLSKAGVKTPALVEGQAVAGFTIAKVNDGKADNLEPATGAGLYAAPITFKVGTAGITATSDSAVVVVGGTAPVVLKEGTPTGFGGYNYGQMPTRLTMNGGQVALTHAITGGTSTTADNSVVSVGSTLLLQKGKPSPDIAGNPTTANFKAFLGETLQSDGPAALIRATTTAPTANNEGLWTNRAPGGATTGAFKQFLRKGDPAPLQPAGITIAKFISYSITTGGDILALVALKGKGITAANDQALYYSYNPSVPAPILPLMEILLQEGNRLPGQDGAKIGIIQMVDYTSRTDVLGLNNSYFGALVTLVNEKGGATAANNLAWVVGDTTLGASAASQRLPVVHMRKGAQSEGPVGKQSIASFTIPVKPVDKSGAGNSGLPHALSAGNRSSSLLVTYPDKSQAIYTIYSPIEGF